MLNYTLQIRPRTSSKHTVIYSGSNFHYTLLRMNELRSSVETSEMLLIITDTAGRDEVIRIK